MGKKRTLLLPLLVVLFFTPYASATLISLPASSHYDGTVWYGVPGSPEDAKGLRGRIDFAVYDTHNLKLQGETSFAARVSVPQTHQYIYAYQVFNDINGASETAVALFQVLNIDREPLNCSGTGSLDDGNGGIAPTSTPAEGLWHFVGQLGGSLIMGKHSFFLIFTSAADWVPGDYKISDQTAEFPAPGGEIPEPATIALLGSAAATLVAVRKRRVG